MDKLVPNPKLKLRDQLKEVMRFKHFSRRTEDAYWLWIKGFIQFHRNRLTSPRPSPLPLRELRGRRIGRTRARWAERKFSRL